MPTKGGITLAGQLAQLQIVVDILARQLCVLDQHQKPELLKALDIARKSFEERNQNTNCIDRVMAFVSLDESHPMPH